MKGIAQFFIIIILLLAVIAILFIGGSLKMNTDDGLNLTFNAGILDKNLQEITNWTTEASKPKHPVIGCWKASTISSVGMLIVEINIKQDNTAVVYWNNELFMRGIWHEQDNRTIILPDRSGANTSLVYDPKTDSIVLGGDYANNMLLDNMRLVFGSNPLYRC